MEGVRRRTLGTLYVLEGAGPLGGGDGGGEGEEGHPEHPHPQLLSVRAPFPSSNLLWPVALPPAALIASHERASLSMGRLGTGFVQGAGETAEIGDCPCWTLTPFPRVIPVVGMQDGAN